jgi:DNA-binding CsgD family transcriptional regulator
VITAPYTRQAAELAATRTRELNETEIKLLQALANGLDYKDITPILGFTSRYSVKNLGYQVQLKMGADNKTHAVAMALRRKLIS